MQRTHQNMDQRVAGSDPGGALHWLERQRAWEGRLRQLEGREPTPTRARPARLPAPAGR